MAKGNSQTPAKPKGTDNIKDKLARQAKQAVTAELNQSQIKANSAIEIISQQWQQKARNVCHHHHHQHCNPSVWVFCQAHDHHFFSVYQLTVAQLTIGLREEKK